MSIEINNLEVNYPNNNKKSKNKYAKILDNINLNIQEKKLTAIIGASGGGKTSFMKTLRGFVDPGSITKGSIIINGNERKQGEWLDKRSVFVDQDELTYKDLTINENLMRTCNFLGKKKSEIEIEDILKTLDLSEKADLKVKSLSGGQYKRFLVARSLVENKDCILLDEPISGLDDMTAYNFIKFLSSECKEKEKTIILTIHQPTSEILEFFDHLIFINKGEIFYSGHVRDVFDKLKSYGIENTGGRSSAFFLIETASSENTKIRESLKKMTEDYNNSFKNNTEIAIPTKKNDSNENYRINFKSILVLMTEQFRSSHIIYLILKIFLLSFCIWIYCVSSKALVKIRDDDAYNIATDFSAFQFVFYFSKFFLFLVPTICLFLYKFSSKKKYYTQELEKSYYSVLDLFLSKIFAFSLYSIAISIISIITIYCSYSGKILPEIIYYMVGLNFFVYFPVLYLSTIIFEKKFLLIVAMTFIGILDFLPNILGLFSIVLITNIPSVSEYIIPVFEDIFNFLDIINPVSLINAICCRLLVEKYYFMENKGKTEKVDIKEMVDFFTKSFEIYAKRKGYGKDHTGRKFSENILKILIDITTKKFNKSFLLLLLRFIFLSILPIFIGWVYFSFSFMNNLRFKLNGGKKNN